MNTKLTIALLLSICTCFRPVHSQAVDNEFTALKKEAPTLGKPQWRGMLNYMADLHQRGTHPAQPPFQYEWEELGLGYHARAFGHWDIVHMILDVLPAMPTHAKHQLFNNLENQNEQGLVPGSIYLDRPWMDEEERYNVYWHKEAGHPAVWPLAAQAYYDQTKDLSVIQHCFEPLVRQIGWFEANRAAQPAGFWYSQTQWENGVDDDLRYQEVVPGPDNPLACIDATAHVYAMYEHAGRWAKLLGEDASEYEKKAEQLKAFIQNDLYDETSGYFVDHWSVDDPDLVVSYVGIWPLVVGAATEQQAKSVIENHLLNPEEFFTKHPIASIGINDPRFELLTWRGPAWNSMTYWAALGSVRYGFEDAARQLVERALDQSAIQFERSGTIWEFYDPFGGKPEDLKREVTPPYQHPRPDYIGHNPLLAMARLYDQLDSVPKSIAFTGNTVSNIDYFDGQLRPVVGVHNIQVMRANRKNPIPADSVGWTYNHAPMLSYWNDTFYLEYLSNVVGEHIPPGRTLLCTSKDGYNWSDPVVIFPPYEVPKGSVKTTNPQPTPPGMHSVMHQRMGFYTAESGRLLVLAFYGISLDADSPNDGGGIGRVVREIHQDGTFGDIYFLRYNVSQGWDEKNTNYPFYTSSDDQGFIEVCNELLADKLMMMQMWEEADRGDSLIVLNEKLKAFSYYHLTDNKVVGLWKWAIGAMSEDNGKSWGPRVDIPGLVTDGGKIWGQQTSDGKYATVYNPSALWRWPLALSTSADGIHYDNMFVVHGEVSQPRYYGKYKDFGPGYIRGIVEGNGSPPDNNLWLTYSVSKEDIWVTSVPVPITETVTEQVDDVFNNLPDGEELDQWNIYSPLWAKVNIEKSEDGTKCLTLNDKAPTDYAKAQRIFPASKNFKVAIELMMVQGSDGVLDIELQDKNGTSPFKFSLYGDGVISYRDGRHYANKLTQLEAKEWHKLTITCSDGNYSASVNDEEPVRVYAVYGTHDIERLVFRTGSEHKSQGASTPFPYSDLPDVSDPNPNPAKYQIKSVKTSAL